MRVLGVRVEDELLKLLEERAKTEGVPVSEVVRRAIKTYLGLPPPPRPTTPEEILSKLDTLERSIEDFRRELSGLHAGLRTLEERFRELEATSRSTSPGTTAVSTNPSTSASPTPTTKPTKSKAWQILERDGISCRSGMRSVKDPDAILNKLMSEGAYGITWDKDRCVFLPELLDELREKLSEIGTPKPEEVERRLAKRLAKLFRALYDAGAVYYDVEKGWVLDETMVETSPPD